MDVREVISLLERFEGALPVRSQLKFHCCSHVVVEGPRRQFGVERSEIAIEVDDAIGISHGPYEPVAFLARELH